VTTSAVGFDKATGRRPTDRLSDASAHVVWIIAARYV
jgi:hypothetical protein